MQHTTVQRGDLTGRVAAKQADAKQDREAAIRATTNALRDANRSITVVPVPGGASFAVPTEVYVRIFGLAEESASRGGVR